MSEERRSPLTNETDESGLLLSVDPMSDRPRDAGLGDDSDATDAGGEDMDTDETDTSDTDTDGTDEADGQD